MRGTIPSPLATLAFEGNLQIAPLRIAQQAAERRLANNGRPSRTLMGLCHPTRIHRSSDEIAVCKHRRSYPLRISLGKLLDLMLRIRNHPERSRAKFLTDRFGDHGPFPRKLPAAGPRLNPKLRQTLLDPMVLLSHQRRLLAIVKILGTRFDRSIQIRCKLLVATVQLLRCQKNSPSLPVDTPDRVAQPSFSPTLDVRYRPVLIRKRRQR